MHTLIIYPAIIYIFMILGTIFLSRYILTKPDYCRLVFPIKITIFFLCIYLNLTLAILSPHGDSAYFSSVMNNLVSQPFLGFYANSGITYPPLFNYLYYMLALLATALHIPLDWRERSFVLFVKLPGILCVLLMAYLIYAYAKKKLPEHQQILLLVVLLLNPAYLFVSAYICQIDSIYCFFVLLTFFLIEKHRLKLCYFTFAIAILFKFQALFVAPVIFYATANDVFIHNFTWKKFWSHLASGLSAIACMFLSYVPFVFDFANGSTTEGGATRNFTNSLASYGFASQNAPNFWVLLGYANQSDQNILGPFTIATWGYINIVLLVVICTVFFILHYKDTSIYPLLGAFLVSGTFCFSHRMMERYLYAAIPLLFWGYVLKPNMKRFLCAANFALAFFIEAAYAYLIMLYDHSRKWDFVDRCVSGYVILSFCFLVYCILTEKISFSKKESS